MAILLYGAFGRIWGGRGCEFISRVSVVSNNLDFRHLGLPGPMVAEMAKMNTGDAL
jgi:hypothetical protein